MKVLFGYAKITLLIGVLLVLAAGCGLAVGSSSGEELPPPEEINLLKSPGFEEGSNENGPIGWRSQADPDHTLVLPEAARTGSLGLKMDSYLVDPEDPDKWKRVVVEQGSTNFIANQTYEYAAWVKTDGPVGMVGLTLAVYFPDGAPRVQHNKWFADGTFDTKGEWQQISLQAHVPENATSLISYLRFEGPGFAYFDDVSLRVVE